MIKIFSILNKVKSPFTVIKMVLNRCCLYNHRDGRFCRIRPWAFMLLIRKCLSSRGSGLSVIWYQHRTLVMSLLMNSQGKCRPIILPLVPRVFCKDNDFAWGQLHKVIHVNELTTALELYPVWVVYFPLFVRNENVKTFRVSIQDPSITD